MKRGNAVPIKTYIGIDNGVSGSLGMVNTKGQSAFIHTPVYNTLNYQKEVKTLNRIDGFRLNKWLREHKGDWTIAIVERPMVNPGQFTATCSALRAFEATLIALERRNIPYQFIDSKEWQKVMLPNGIKGSDKLKLASKEVGIRLFPWFIDQFKQDADGMLIAEWARRIKL